MRLIIGVFLSLSIATATYSSTISLSVAENTYRQAFRYEELRLYEKAYSEYYKLNKQLVLKLANQSKSISPEYLSLAISTAFRMSINNSKRQFNTFNKLIDQIKGFSETLDEINGVLAIIKQYNQQSKTPVPQSQYGHLLFARAYTQIGLSYKLLNSIAWKQYIVYPQSDILDMIHMAMLDLNQVLKFEDIPRDLIELSVKNSDISPSNRLAGYETILSEKISKLDSSSIEFQTLQRLDLKNDPVILAKSYAKRMAIQVYDVLAYYYSDRVQKTLKDQRNEYSLESILGEANKPVFEIVTKLTEKIGLK